MKKFKFLVTIFLIGLTTVSWAQKKINGTVIDSDGYPLPGASVVEKGTTNGAISDFNGEYSIETSSDTPVLVASYMGFETMEKTVGPSVFTLDFVLKEASNVLDDVVVIGYGTSSKEKITGSVVSIDAESIQEYSNANFDQAIVGKLPGVDILTNARNPGDGNTITIRGAGSITRSANPLVVVDGFPLAEGSSLNVINPNDIASIDVIKDAASSAIYGSRAANGLIMITTKEGRSKKTTVQINSVAGIQERTGTYDLLNAYDAAIFFRDGRNNAYLKNHNNVSVNDTESQRIANGANVRELLLDYTLPYLNNEQGLMDFNWEDAVYRAGIVQNHHINVSGSNDATNYSVSLGYTDEEGIVITADQKRYTTNIKFNTKLSERLKFGANMNGYYSERGLTNGSNQYRFPIDPAGRAMVYMYPFFSAYDDSHPTGYNIEAQIRANRPYNANLQENPVAMAELSKYDRREFRTFGNAYLSYEPIDNLELKTSLGYLLDYKFTDQYAPMLTGAYRELISERNPQQGSESRSDQGDVLIENTANYTFDIGQHSFNALAGQSFQKSSSSGLSVDGFDFPNDIIENIDGSTVQTAGASRSRWTQLSYFGRIMYDYKDTYFLSGSIRTDGSSRFGRDNRYGTFGSFSAGWVLSNESFFPENDILTFAKLRYSWGQTGNNQIGNYAQYASIGTGRDYPYDGTLHPGAAPSSAPSYALTWETNTSNNFGVDLSFFNKIRLGVDYYVADITDLLLDRPVPKHTGFNNSLQNIGEMRNKGWEFQLSGSNFNLGDLSFGFDANLATNNNEILSLGGADELFEGGNQRFITRVGESLANLYGYKIIGILKSEEEVAEYNNRKNTTLSAEVGDYIFQDTDGNDTIDANDRVLLGDYNPEVTYGFGINLAYKGFDMSLNFNGTVGRMAFDEMTSRYLEYGEAFTNTNYHYFNNYWDPVHNPDGFLAPPDAYGNTATRSASRNPTNYNVLDADYLRLRSVQLGYNIPSDVLEQLHLKNLRVYVSANNLHTWTKFRGMNPDGGNTGNPLNRGHIFGTTAVPRLISAGINLTFQ
ncbi:SusC/RagA family TonB-linked outer membrane protein [Muricauda sp. TY007]|uniref:SusC/RagA family TonB-linked outer membrane protein n=1 Tax=Allomuricauda sp. TY007 TaxID=2683200 RepID=UPI0013C053EF|nr:TonB-dependent receptor [Muricauda sp. TY007]NDV16334.1 SusC/RagA family TonB-linked outer membrane protein [Muricauda sp. TY007]